LDGSEEGSLDGSEEGSLDGSEEGSLDGSEEGSLDGSEEGSLDGSEEGSLEDSEEVSPDGSVGWAVSVAVGSCVSPEDVAGSVGVASSANTSESSEQQSTMASRMLMIFFDIRILLSTKCDRLSSSRYHRFRGKASKTGFF
ncbi:MAG: hypothetical protein IJL00_02270, partial [Clostridia bacterium]|nr:hypothetical protein [Clostridia bacterium]